MDKGKAKSELGAAKAALKDSAPDTEIAVLANLYNALNEGGGFIKREDAVEIIAVLEPDDFSNAGCREVFKAFQMLISKGGHATRDLLKFYAGSLDGESVADRIENGTIVSDINIIKSQCQFLRDLALKKKLLNVVAHLSIKSGKTAEQNAQDFMEQISTAGGLVFEKFLFTADELPKAYAARLAKKEFAKIETKINALDGKVDFRPGNLVIISARTGQGKTAFALQLMLNLTTQAQPVPCMYFTMEVSALDLFERLAVNFYQQPSRQIQQRALNVWNDETKLAEEFGVLGYLKYCIYDKPRVEVGEIVRAVKARVLQEGTRIVFIDYLGLIKVNEYRERYEAIGEISRRLKSLARELNVAIFLLVQVNRDPEKRANKTPQLSDLRDSGSVEQDADVVLFIHRPFQIALKEYYEKDAQAVAENKKRPEPPKFDPQNEPIKIVIAKNRTGQTGDINLTFMPQFQRYEEPTGYDVTTIEFKG